jgi:hypothetical protein
VKGKLFGEASLTAREAASRDDYEPFKNFGIGEVLKNCVNLRFSVMVF